MLIVLLSFAYMLAICLVAGIIVNKALSRFIPVVDLDRLSITGIATTGFVALSVYAEIFSLFYKVGAICHVLMLITLAVCGYFLRKELSLSLTKLKSIFIKNRTCGLTYTLIILAAAFFTSRGKFHTDTGIYHAQAIRVIEEYGVVRGLANLQQHFGYNSAYLSFCALFTLSFILPFALHTVTGAVMALYTCYAVKGLFDWKEHEFHVGDFARIAILIYAFTEMVGLQSPATDYGTMFFAMYILCEWAVHFVERRSNSTGTRKADDKKTVNKTQTASDIAVTGRLTILSVFAVSMKLSAAAMVILVVFPLFLLVKEKMWKELISYLIIGLICIAPFLARNVILSGWLIYPVDSIDLFNLVWKVPADYLRHDAAQIKVWGRCLYDVEKLHAPISDWLPIWWSEKAHYEEMLIYSQILGILLLALTFVRRLASKSLRPGMVIFYGCIIANLILWFMTAPFIRYGLAFLLLLPLCMIGENASVMVQKKSIVLALLIGVIFINFASWIDNYFTDNMVFVKHHLAENYYIVPIPFEDSNVEAVDLDGVTVYISSDEKNSYYYTPNSCYGGMVERTKPIGKTVKEGFMPR